MNNDKILVQNIRAQYTEKERTPLDALKELDAKVKRPANVFAGVSGTVSALVMGAGMSLIMTDIGTTVGLENAMLPGVIIGVIGLALALLTYPVYNRILMSRRKKYAAKVLEMSDGVLAQ